jgi:hypothetical protein
MGINPGGAVFMPHSNLLYYKELFAAERNKNKFLRGWLGTIFAY